MSDDMPVMDRPDPIGAAAPVSPAIRKAKVRRPGTPAAILPVAAAPAAPFTAPTEGPIMDDTTTTTTTTTAASQAETVFKDASARGEAALGKGQQMLAELGDFTKGNYEAVVESSQIAWRGLESMSQGVAAYAKSSFEGAAAQARTLAAAKSPTEFVKLQGDYVRQAFDAMVAEGSRSTESMLKLAGEVAQPLSNRLALAASKIKAAA